MLNKFKSWMNREDKKGTPLWKALFFENRFPWRYKVFLYRYFIYPFSKNVNTKEYWNCRLDDYEGDKWRDNVYEDLLKYLPKNKNFSLLDIGCALGDGCILLKRNFPNANINGCDFSNIAIKKAKNKNKNINFFELDILKQDLSKKYDYITMVSILEHFDNPFPIIDKCLEKINKKLIINCPYGNTIGYTPDNEHRFAFNEDTLKNYDNTYFKKGKRIIYLVNKNI